MIKTKDISLSKNKYFSILAGVRFQQSWYIYLLPFAGAIAIHFLMEDSEMLTKFLVVYGLINPIWILIYLGIHVNSKKAANVPLSRYYQINGDKITAFHADESTNNFLIEDIIDVKKAKNELLIYFSKSEFIYLPNNSFEKDDLSVFVEVLKKQGKLK